MVEKTTVEFETTCIFVECRVNSQSSTWKASRDTFKRFSREKYSTSMTFKEMLNSFLFCVFIYFIVKK